MNDLPVKLVRLLADGGFLSGAALARTLGVSRGTIWNAVRVLEKADLEIYKVRGRGYKLSASISMLDMEKIERCVSTCSPRLTIEIIDTAASTNTLLMQRAAAGARSGTVLAVEWQHEGRGRMGRPWHAGLGRALTFSVLWRFEQGAGAIGGLSLAVGVALVRAIHALGATEVALKWPNDVLWRGRKLAGILIEMQGDALGPSAVVIGVGLNVRLSSALAARIDQPAADLETACGRALDRSEALGTVLDALARVLKDFSNAGFAPLRKEWERYHGSQGQPVTVRLPTGKTERGEALGVADDGALLFRTGDRVRALHSGEISLRASAPAAASGMRAGPKAKATS
jgi:BirA family transcriptional regulator, biotin operon repressor / biotin---[acetyl-CoA-carboxylase] ligase